MGRGRWDPRLRRIYSPLVRKGQHGRESRKNKTEHDDDVDLCFQAFLSVFGLK